MIRRPPRSTLSSSSAASDVYKRQGQQSLAEVAFRHEARRYEGRFSFRDALVDVNLEELVIIARGDSLFFGFGFFVPANAAFEEGMQVNSEERRPRWQGYVDAELEGQSRGRFEVVLCDCGQLSRFN